MTLRPLAQNRANRPIKPQFLSQTHPKKNRKLLFYMYFLRYSWTPNEPMLSQGLSQ